MRHFVISASASAALVCALATASTLSSAGELTLRLGIQPELPSLPVIIAAERDLYICPNGRPLRTSGTVHDGRIRNYLPHLGDCRVCKLKERCTRAPFRKLTRDINEEARDHARSLKGTPEFERSSDQRKKIEMRFAHLKTHHRFERLRLRGLSGARDEFHLAAVVQNLKTLATCLWRSPPNLSAACLT